MSKRPPKKGPMPPHVFAGSAGMPGRATVGLPPSAGGGGTGAPGSIGKGAPARVPGQAEILDALRIAGGHFEAKRFAVAAAIAQEILRFQPSQPDALHLLGLIALAMNEPAEAEKLLAKAASLMPRHANLIVNLGNAMREQGKAAEALELYARAIALDPALEEAYFHRGLLYKTARRQEEALGDFQRLIELTPEKPAPYLRACETEMDRGHYRSALAYWQKARARMSELHADNFVIAADICERLSELDAALAFAEEALAVDGAHVGANRIWAKIRRRQAGQDAQALAEIRTRLEALDTSGASFGIARDVHAQIGQICDRTNDVDGAFRHFTLQNEIAGREADATGIDRRKYPGQIEALTHSFTPEKVAAWRPLAPLAHVPEPGHRSVPVFLVGFPRSGTTLLDQILDAHPDIQVFEEKPTLITVRDGVDEREGGYPEALAELDEKDRGELRARYWRALEAEGADLAGRIVVNKLPLNIVHAGLVQRVFPEAKFILALRHPADCVLSCFMQDFQLNASMVQFLTLEDSARLYDSVMTLWRSYERLLPLDVKQVRYERLIAGLEGEVRPVLGWLGVPWHEAVRDPAAHARARGTIRTPSYSQVIEPLYSRAADRWRRYEKYLAPVMPMLEAHIRHFGYTP